MRKARTSNSEGRLRSVGTQSGSHPASVDSQPRWPRPSALHMVPQDPSELPSRSVGYDATLVAEPGQPTVTESNTGLVGRGVCTRVHYTHRLCGRKQAQGLLLGTWIAACTWTRSGGAQWGPDLKRNRPVSLPPKPPCCRATQHDLTRRSET